VRILQGGSIQGETWVAQVVVNGHVKGDIFASKQVKLASKAVVEGNIHYNLIEIERGAEVVGSFVHEQPQTNVTAFPKDGRAEDSSESSKKADKQSI
jgi:cytoskeletal protein CcmA (bactofilin family)